ncbi:MAG TPA: hypothetical protein VNX25_00805, partial [Verrucomicrobiae bacterium]|nr:hypothetical protein [Verrucomicrobiae bacterium]
MPQSWKCAAATLVAAAVAAGAAGVAVMYSGMIDVSALKKDSELTAWVKETTMKKSVARRMRQVSVPR